MSELRLPAISEEEREALAATVNTTADNNVTALMLATHSGHFDVARLLVHVGADILRASTKVDSFCRGRPASSRPSLFTPSPSSRPSLFTSSPCPLQPCAGLPSLSLAQMPLHSRPLAQPSPWRSWPCTAAPLAQLTPTPLACAQGCTALAMATERAGIEHNVGRQKASGTFDGSWHSIGHLLVCFLLEAASEAEAREQAREDAERAHSPTEKSISARRPSAFRPSAGGRPSLVHGSGSGIHLPTGFSGDVYKGASLITSVHQLINFQDEYGTSSLMLASQYGDVATLRLLLERRAEVNLTMRDGSDALMMAARDGRAFTCSVLIDAKAQVTAARSDGRSALTIAATYGHTDTVRLLVERNADVNKSGTKDGRSPLMRASMCGSRRRPPSTSLYDLP